MYAGISFWRPVPPKGYVPMGCIASTAQPDRKSCVVVARQAVVTALLSECMMQCTNGNLWCIQNSMGTFEVAAPDAHHPKVRSTVHCVKGHTCCNPACVGVGRCGRNRLAKTA
jgi:hypothetical protein